MKLIPLLFRTGCLCVVFLWGCLTPVFAVQDGDTIVIGAEEIRSMQALKIADVLNNVPGVTAGDSSVGIHGSYKVKVFVDGRSINDPTSSHGGINWDMVSLDDVTRIEILRGKGGLIYGQDASGGVILISTRQVRQLTGNIMTYGGNHNTGNARATVSTTAGPMTVGVSGGYETTDGYKINNDKERYQAGVKLSMKTAEGKNFVLSADHLQDERGLSGLPERPTPASRKDTCNTAYALLSDIWRLKSKTHYNNGRRHNTDTSRGLDKTLRVSKFGQDLTTDFKTTDRGNLTTGAGFIWDRADGTGFDDQEEHAFSLFAAQSFRWPTIHTSVTIGLRASRHSNFNDRVNPEIKVTYKKPTWHVTAAYSSTNNTPSFYQRYNETSSTRPNPDLEMEKADNFGLSLFITPRKSISFNLSGFYNLLTDRITYVAGDEGIGQYQNFGDVLYAGGDAAFSWQLHPAVKAKGSYTYLEAEDRETNFRLPGKAQHTADLSVYWQPAQPLSIVLTGKYISEVFRNKSNTKTVPEYTIADIRVEYAFKRFSLFSEVKNIFDKTYFYADGLLARPRTWVAGVNWRI
jgi:iron complex outermembrane receptor protein